MATFSKPTTIARWNDDQTNNVEPSEGKKDEGWLFEEVHPSSFENWRTNLNGLWWKWIDERFSDGGTPDILQIKDPSATVTNWAEFSAGSVSFLDAAITLSDTGGGQLAVGDATFLMDFSIADTPQITFDTLDSIQFLRATNRFFFLIANANKMELGATGLKIPNGLRVGSTLSPNFQDVMVTGGLNCGGTRDPFVGEGIFSDGIAVGFDTINPTNDTVHVGDANFQMSLASGTPIVLFDSTDFFEYNRSTNAFGFRVANIVEVQIAAAGLNVVNGLRVGSLTAPNDQDIMVDGGINCGGATNPGQGEGIFTDGLVVGFSSNPSTDMVHVGDLDFSMDFNTGDPQIRFEGTTNAIRCDRSENSLIFRLANVDRMFVDGALFGPVADKGFDIGSSSVRWNAGFFMEAQFHLDQEDPGSQDGLTGRYATNCVIGWGSVSTGGTLQTGHYNAVSVASVISSVYLVTLDDNVDADCGVSAMQTGASAGFCNGRVVPGGGQIEVRTFNASGTPTDRAFNYIIIGQPQTLPTQ